MYVERNIEARSCNHCCIGKAKIITCSEFMLIALGIQHGMRMRRILLLSVACFALQYFFPHCLINDTMFEKYH